MPDPLPTDPSIIPDADRKNFLPDDSSVPGLGKGNPLKPEQEVVPAGVQWVQSIVEQGEDNAMQKCRELFKEEDIAALRQKYQEILKKYPSAFGEEYTFPPTKQPPWRVGEFPEGAVVHELRDFTWDLASTIRYKKPDMVYIAPRSAFMPAWAAKTCCQELKDNYGQSKLKTPYFFFPHNKLYKNWSENIFKTYSTKESVPEDLEQIAEDLGIALDEDDMPRETQLQRERDEILEVIDAVDDATETIRQYASNHPGQINICIYDECVDSGRTFRRLEAILDQAIKRLPELDIKLGSVSGKGSSRPNFDSRLLKHEGGKIGIQHFGDNKVDFLREKGKIELAQFCGKVVARTMALLNGIQEEFPFNAYSKRNIE